MDSVKIVCQLWPHIFWPKKKEKFQLWNTRKICSSFWAYNHEVPGDKITQKNIHTFFNNYFIMYHLSSLSPLFNLCRIYHSKRHKLLFWFFACFNFFLLFSTCLCKHHWIRACSLFLYNPGNIEDFFSVPRSTDLC